MTATFNVIRGKQGRGRIAEGIFDCCCHRVSYWWDLHSLPTFSEEEKSRLLAQLEDDAFERAKSCIGEGYCSGELCTLFLYDDEREVEIWGHWRIQP